MTLFEYLAIAFGLLYSVAALRLLGGLPAAMDPRRRYSLHLGLLLVNLFVVIVSFWTFWSLRDVEWTFMGFLVALTIPGLLFYMAAVLVPENPEDVASWRDHYFSVHTRWFGGMAAWGIGAATSASMNLGMGLAHPARLVHLLTVGIGVLGTSTARPRVHGVIVSAMCLLVVATLAAHLSPGWLAQP